MRVVGRGQGLSAAEVSVVVVDVVVVVVVVVAVVVVVVVVYITDNTVVDNLEYIILIVEYMVVDHYNIRIVVDIVVDIVVNIDWNIYNFLHFLNIVGSFILS